MIQGGNKPSTSSTEYQEKHRSSQVPKDTKNSRVVTERGEGAAGHYRFMSQFGRRLDIISSRVPTTSAGKRLMR